MFLLETYNIHSNWVSETLTFCIGHLIIGHTLFQRSKRLILDVNHNGLQRIYIVHPTVY